MKYTKFKKTILPLCLTLSLMLNFALIYKDKYIQKCYNSIITSKEYKNTTLSFKNPIVNLNPEESISYTCIGNSITLHPITDYWHSERGMAATTPTSDYPHVLYSMLSNDFEKVHYTSYNFASWEINYYDRGEYLSEIDEFLKDELDFVILQLGENIENNTTLESDFIELINYCKDKTNNAQIFVLGNFWENKEIEIKKMNACTETLSYYLPLTDIQGNKYKTRINSNIYEDDGSTSIVKHPGVSMHPNDIAFEYIANAIYDSLNLN